MPPERTILAFHIVNSSLNDREHLWFLQEKDQNVKDDFLCVCVGVCVCGGGAHRVINNLLLDCAKPKGYKFGE